MNPLEEGIKEFVATVASLNKALEEAGGVAWSLQDFEGMNLLDFLAHIAPNGIRFIHGGKPVPREKVS